MEEWKKVMEGLGNLFDELAKMCSEQIDLAKELEQRFAKPIPEKELKEEWRMRLRKLQERVEETQRGLEELEDKLDELQDKLEGLLDRLEELNERLEELQEMLE